MTHYILFGKFKKINVIVFAFLGTFHHFYNLLTKENIKKLYGIEKEIKKQNNKIEFIICPIKKGINEFVEYPLVLYGYGENSLHGNFSEKFKPFITANSADSFIKQLREHIKTSDIMYSYLLSGGRQVPTDVNKKIMGYLEESKNQFSKKKILNKSKKFKSKNKKY